MIHITKGQINYVYVTIKEKRVNAADVLSDIPYMKFVNDMTKAEFYLYPYTTIAPRFTRLAIDAREGGAHSLPDDEGFYTYTIYEVTDATFGNDGDSSLTDSQIVETGKAFIKNPAITGVAYTQYTPTDNVNTTNSNTQYLSI
jgi:hypothetical protein